MGRATPAIAGHGRGAVDGDDPAITLGTLGARRAIEPLIQLLGHPDSAVYSGAAVALGAFADPRAVEPLLALLPLAPPGADQGILWTLGKIGDKRALAPLVA